MNKQEAIEIIEQDKMRVGKLVEMNSGAHSIQQKMKLVDYAPLEVVVNVINQIHEPQKVVVPKFVAEWIEECKGRGCPLRATMIHVNLPEKVNAWLLETSQDEFTYPNQDIFAHAWLFGYEIEQEKLYEVTVPGTSNYKNQRQHLVKQGKHWFFCGNDVNRFKYRFTKGQIEAAGFGWVFDCDGVKVVEVE